MKHLDFGKLLEMLQHKTQPSSASSWYRGFPFSSGCSQPVSLPLFSLALLLFHQ